jgi:hypothetical protein
MMPPQVVTNTPASGPLGPSDLKLNPQKRGCSKKVLQCGQVGGRFVADVTLIGFNFSLEQRGETDS